MKLTTAITDRIRVEPVMGTKEREIMTREYTARHITGHSICCSHYSKMVKFLFCFLPLLDFFVILANEVFNIINSPHEKQPVAKCDYHQFSALILAIVQSYSYIAGAVRIVCRAGSM